MPDIRTATPTRRFEVAADRVLAWLATATDPDGLPFQESYGFDSTFHADGYGLYDRIQILVDQAQTDGVLTIPNHHLALWQVADEGFLLTVDPPHPPRLCTRHLSITDLLLPKTTGSVAVYAVLYATAQIANNLLDEHDRSGRRNGPTGPSRPTDVASGLLDPPPHDSAPGPAAITQPRHR